MTKASSQTYRIGWKYIWWAARMAGFVVQVELFKTFGADVTIFA